MNRPQPLTDLVNLWASRGYKTWKPFMKKYNCQVIAEIGVFKGRNFEKMIRHQPEIAVAVDAWIDDGVSSRNDKGYSQKHLDQIYDNFKKKTADIAFVKIYRKYSTDAAQIFPDGYFDLVYIDADHSFEGCYGDLESWYPKVKKGGFLTGDDYHNSTLPRVKFEVVRAVNTFALKHSLRFYELPDWGWAFVK